MELTQEQVKFYLPKINNIFQQAYGDKYLGLDWINKRATNFYIFKVENSVVGCAVMDKNKIIAIEINSAGKGHGTKLLTKIKQHNPNAWVTVEIDSVAMIKALAKSGFTLVNNADKINNVRSCFSGFSLANISAVSITYSHCNSDKRLIFGLP